MEFRDAPTYMRQYEMRHGHKRKLEFGLFVRRSREVVTSESLPTPATAALFQPHIFRCDPESTAPAG